MIEHHDDNNDHQDLYAFQTRIEEEFLIEDQQHEKVLENLDEIERIDRYNRIKEIQLN